MLLHERPRALAGLPPPAPLPGLTTALSRRAAIFGAVAASGVLAGSGVRAATDKISFADAAHAQLPTVGTIVLTDSDARLIAMAADICTTLDGAAYAFDPVSDEDDQDRRLGRANDLTLDMAALPAIGLAGVLAKAKAYLDSCSYDVLQLAELADSLAEDVERVLEGRVA